MKKSPSLPFVLSGQRSGPRVSLSLRLSYEVTFLHMGRNRHALRSEWGHGTRRAPPLCTVVHYMALVYTACLDFFHQEIQNYLHLAFLFHSLRFLFEECARFWYFTIDLGRLSHWYHRKDPLLFSFCLCGSCFLSFMIVLFQRYWEDLCLKFQLISHHWFTPLSAYCAA